MIFQRAFENPVELSVRQRAVEKERGRKWFRSLSRWDKDELGNQFVLGDFDWRDWLEQKPSSAFLAGAEDERIHWEMMGGH